MVPFNLALVVTSLVMISIHVFMRRRSRLFCFSKDTFASFESSDKEPRTSRAPGSVWQIVIVNCNCSWQIDNLTIVCHCAQYDWLRHLLGA